MKNGFTIVELLATIVIVGIILLVSSIGVINTINNINEESYNNNITAIKNATKNYIALKSSSIVELNTKDATYTITLQDLNDEGLIELPIKNHLKNKNFDQELFKIIITTNENTHTITIEDNTVY